MSKLRPVNGNVIIRPIEEEEQMSGNIIIPDMGKERPEISIKLYKSKPDFAEFKKQMRRVAGHEFGG